MQFDEYLTWCTIPLSSYINHLGTKKGDPDLLAKGTVTQHNCILTSRERLLHTGTLANTSSNTSSKSLLTSLFTHLAVLSVATYKPIDSCLHAVLRPQVKCLDVCAVDAIELGGTREGVGTHIWEDQPIPIA